MDTYFASTTVISNMQDTTGWNLFSVWDWFGTDLIKPFLGMMFYSIEHYWPIILVLIIIGGVLQLAHIGYIFFKT